MMSFRIAARTILLGVASVAFLAVPQATSAVVVVVGGDLEMVVFEVPAGSTYQIYYPTGQGADFQVWRDPDATIPVVPLQNYTVQSRGDFNQDGLLNGADIQGFVGAFVNGPFNSAGDFDGDMDIDTTDATAFVEELLYPCPVAAVVLYVEALEASAAVNDSQIDLIIGQLPPAFSELVTSVDLTVSPLTINLGTTVTVMITPTGGDLVFDQNTSASWHGYFDAVVGSDSEQFSLSYSSTQFAEL
ncbi:MAG TPA: hypothetical protein VNT79_14890, partial [Phycisphaerae bacterium]|nr:hypothetical protein [Phycisphaerae bacterium]